MNEISSELIHELSAGMFRLIRGMIRDRDEALDLTQDVLVRLLGRPVPTDPALLKGYAMKAAYHAALNASRDRKRRTRIHERLQAEAEMSGRVSADIQDSHGTARITARLRQALEQLPDKQREAIELRFYGCLTIDETSEAMRISSGSVKVHVYRALNRLSRILSGNVKETQK
jgi:RNA polymerase sigma-70 factor (ECF subfamily)